MKRLLGGFGVMVLLVLLSGPASPAEPSKAKSDPQELSVFKQAIREKYTIKEKAFAERDVEALVTRFYAADAITTSEGGVVVGRDQQRATYTTTMKTAYSVKISSVYTYVKGNTGWDWANFQMSPLGSSDAPFNARILFLWAKVNGEWICKGDMSVSGKFDAGAPASSTDSK
jgi:Domain of unknown function (DUF4440)